MNWFTKSLVVSLSPEKKADAVAKWGGCEHVQADSNLLHTISYENDTWGREGYCICKECLDKQKEEENNEEIVCPDCQTTVIKKNTRTWRWYDFYAASGDEPLVICNSCWTKEKHQGRMQRDEYDRQQEMDD